MEGDLQMRALAVVNGILISMLLSLAPIGVRPVSAQDSLVGTIVGRASGSGQIEIAPGRTGSFSFRINPLTPGEMAPGQVRFIDRLTGETVVSQVITDGFIAPGLVYLEGICTIDGRLGVFQMEAFDAGRPGERDSFFLCYEAPLTGGCVGGLLPTASISVGFGRIR
jgi:hypothetical protein